MTFDVLSDLNWLAVVVATVAYFLLGSLWYTVLFGRAWARASGVEFAEEEAPSPAIYLAPLLAYLVSAIATAMLASVTGSDTYADGVVLGLVVGVGYAVMFAFVSAVFDRRPQPNVWFAINASFNLVGLLIVAIIVSVWD
ncbi:MAG TPA: DUF1761 domain-containing protein [Nitriliruptorales bacterium]|nr:DUF1761 domain-containing protein [Nitriliruptorales bacterium]